MELGLLGPDGQPIKAVSTKRGEQLVQLAHAQRAEAVMASRVFYACDDGNGNAPGTALGTNGIFALENPLQSGIKAIVLVVSMGYISGTLGAGSIFYTADDVPSSAVPIATGTDIEPRSALLGSGARGRIIAWDNPTLLNTPTPIRPFCNLDASLATTAGIGTPVVVDHVDGEFTLAPGSVLCMQGIAAAGTSPLVAFGMTWEEVPN